MIEYEDAVDWLKGMHEFATDGDKEIIEWILERLWIDEDLRSS